MPAMEEISTWNKRSKKHGPPVGADNPGIRPQRTTCGNGIRWITGISCRRTRDETDRDNSGQQISEKRIPTDTFGKTCRINARPHAGQSSKAAPSILRTAVAVIGTVLQKPRKPPFNGVWATGRKTNLCLISLKPRNPSAARPGQGGPKRLAMRIEYPGDDRRAAASRQPTFLSRASARRNASRQRRAATPGIETVNREEVGRARRAAGCPSNAGLP